MGNGAKNFVMGEQWCSHGVHGLWYWQPMLDCWRCWSYRLRAPHPTMVVSYIDYEHGRIVMDTVDDG